jgi:hypothetical protein
MDTAWELLEGAALTLARSGSIKDRLADAYRNHLSQLDSADLPEPLRPLLSDCQLALTREQPQRGEDAVRATVRKMSAEEAEQLAGTVMRLFAAMARESVHAERDAAATAAARPKILKAVPQVISLYAAEGSRTPNRA